MAQAGTKDVTEWRATQVLVVLVVLGSSSSSSSTCDHRAKKMYFAEREKERKRDKKMEGDRRQNECLRHAHAHAVCGMRYAIKQGRPVSTRRM